MPDYGILDAYEGEGLLPWDWAAERLSVSHNYLVATTRPGRSRAGAATRGPGSAIDSAQRGGQRASH